MDLKLALGLTLIALAHVAAPGSAEKVLRYMPTEYSLWSDNVLMNYSFAMDAKVPYVNITIRVLQDIKDIDVHFEGSLIGKKDPSHFFNFNATYNFCNLLAWKSSSPLGMLAFAYLKDYGRLPDSCPIPKGEYKLHRIWFPEDPVTSTLPEVDFHLTLQSFVTTADGAHVKELAMNDSWKGEATVTDVPSIKKGVLSFLPKMHVMG